MQLPAPLQPQIDAAADGGIPAVDDAERRAIERARAGDRRAFGELHSRYVRMVHAIVMAHASPGDADDLTQEVFTRALVNIQNLQRADSAGPWFAGIARNVATDSVRRRKPSVELTDIAAARPARGRVDDARDVLESIQTIPVTYRETLMMRLVEGMTGPEIALRTGMTPGSVRVHLHRGMKQLTEILARRGLLQ